MRPPGDFLLHEESGGFVTYELYLGFATYGYLKIFDLWVRRLRYIFAPQESLTVRDTPPLLLRCPSCRSNIACNRVEGELFTCAVCRQLIRAARTRTALEDEVRAAVGFSGEARDLYGHMALLGFQATRPASGDRLEQLAAFLRDYGAELIAQDHPGAVLLFLQAQESGLLSVAAPIVYARYRIAGGTLGVPERTPPDVERLVRDVRETFSDLRLNSASLPYDPNDDHPYTLIAHDRLDEAEAKLQAAIDSAAAAAYWLLLSQVALMRDDVTAARRWVSNALELRPMDTQAWVVAGWVALRDGDVDAAQRAAARALDQQPMDASASALMATVLHEQGDSAGAARMARRARALLVHDELG
ncbi:MAG TPA: tetratricopeptide repeat protein [Frankiaceae bacterium]|nr:tetratricopeptide repeat protein [Frankiaceae bacterium]